MSNEAVEPPALIKANTTSTVDADAFINHVGIHMQLVYPQLPFLLTVPVLCSQCVTGFQSLLPFLVLKGPNNEPVAVWSLVSRCFTIFGQRVNLISNCVS